MSKEIKAENFFNAHQEIFYPPSEFDGYEIVNENKDNLMNICMLLSNNLANIQNICFDDKYEFVDSLVDAGFITKDFEQQFNLTEIVTEINRIIKSLNYNIKLTVEDILCRDDQKVKCARQNFEYLTYYDLNVCAKIIEEQGYKLFQVFLDCGGYTMSILPQSKLTELKKYCNYSPHRSQ